EFDNRILNQLPADPETKNFRRQVHQSVYSFVDPTPVSEPKLIAHAEDVAALLDLSSDQVDSKLFTEVFSGNSKLPNMQPYAMCYGGHQFGNWAGQLGDGRAINLGEIKNKRGEHWALQLKGSGPTPYSRSADGLAVLRSSVREFLCSEAMYHLRVPTTRALSLMTTGEGVLRDMLYDGNAEYEPGAIVCRVAPSFLRFGNYQLFASRQELEELRTLVNFTIEHHFPHLLETYEQDSSELIFAWFEEVCQLTVTMIVDWMRVGFVHGVMNTDNMSILGLTIDYGPYGWLDDFNPDWTPNTTDAQQRRYRYGQQPNVALWNLYQLANSLYPLTEQADGFERALEAFQANYQSQWLSMMRAKLGLEVEDAQDIELCSELENVLVETEIDMTLFYRLLSERNILEQTSLDEVYYAPQAADLDHSTKMQAWLNAYRTRLAIEKRSDEARFTAMQAVNPKFVLRNYLAQQAIDLAESGDYSMIHELLTALKTPYDNSVDPKLCQKRPDWARTKVGCSMLSCSS
ncbi:MAG: YdiU family protein, partial [Pseudomonadota bacterium]